VELQLHTLLTSALDGGEWSASRPSRFILRVRAPGPHWIGDWMGPITGLDAVAKRKSTIIVPCRGLNPCRPARSLVAVLAELRLKYDISERNGLNVSS